MSRFNAINRLLASAGMAPVATEDQDIVAGDPAPTGDQPPATPAPPPPPPAPAAQADTVPQADAVAAVSAARDQGHAAGAAAERARWNAVLEAPEATGKETLAAFMLNNSTAEAPAIIGKLKDAPAGAAARGAPPSAAEKAAGTGASRQPTARVPVGQAAGAATAHQEGDGEGEEGETVVGAQFWQGIGAASSNKEMSARIAGDRGIAAGQALGTAAAAAPFRTA